MFDKAQEECVHVLKNFEFHIYFPQCTITCLNILLTKYQSEVSEPGALFLGIMEMLIKCYVFFWFFYLDMIRFIAHSLNTATNFVFRSLVKSIQLPFTQYDKL